MRWVYVLFILISSHTANAANMNCLLNHLMGTGASVSSGLDGTSFVDQLAQKYLTQKKVIHEAYPGVAGEVIVSYSSFAQKTKAASLVLAMDIFYWDQIACNSADWEARINKTINLLFDRTMKMGVPIVVGNLTRGKEPFNRLKYEAKCADLINEKLKATCDENPKKCLFVDNDEVVKYVTEKFSTQMAAMLGVERTDFTRAHITRDGVHPRTDAYAMIADFLDQKIRESKLECK